MSKKPKTLASPELLEAVAEINELRSEVVRLSGHSVALNQVMAYLLVEMGLMNEGNPEIEIVPLEVARQALAWKGEHQ